MLTLCVSQADASLNPVAYLAGVVASSGGGRGRGDVEEAVAAAEGEPAALRLRLRSLLAACLDYVEGEPNKVRVYMYIGLVDWLGGELAAREEKKERKNGNGMEMERKRN